MELKKEKVELSKGLKTGNDTKRKTRKGENNKNDDGETMERNNKNPFFIRTTFYLWVLM